MVLSSVSAGDVKLRMVMLCNVMMDQMFLDGHGFVQNSKEKEGDRKRLCIEWLCLCFSIKSQFFRVYLSILGTLRVLLGLMIKSRMCMSAPLAPFEVCSWAKTGINSCLVQKCNCTVIA